ncbi:MAG TPA: rod shape-determining protein MreC [Terriglobia bacterium]
MDFHRESASLVSRYRSLVLLAVVLLSQVFLLAYQLRRDQDIPLVRYGTVLMVTPIQKGLRAVMDGVQGVWYGYVNLHGARRQNEELARERDELKLENHRLREQADEARRLQVLFDLAQEVPSRTLVARVIGASSSETARMLTIDKGRNAGLEPDLPVIVPDGVVGKVLHVFPNAAQVLLITDPYSGVASLLEDSRVHGIVKGQNQALCSLAYVPRGEEVQVGQKLYTSGEDQVYPKGLPVGQVVEVLPGPEFLRIAVQPLAPLNRLEEVLVILQPELVKLEIPVVPVAAPQAPAAEAPAAGQAPAATPATSSPRPSNNRATGVSSGTVPPARVTPPPASAPAPPPEPPPPPAVSPSEPESPPPPAESPSAPEETPPVSPELSAPAEPLPGESPQTPSQ